MGSNSWGDAVMTRQEDGTVTVDRADPVIGVMPELLDHADPWMFPNGDQEIIQLDTAGEYLYRKIGATSSEYAWDRTVLLYERVESHGIG